MQISFRSHLEKKNFVKKKKTTDIQIGISEFLNIYCEFYICGKQNQVFRTSGLISYHTLAIMCVNTKSNSECNRLIFPLTFVNKCKSGSCLYLSDFWKKINDMNICKENAYVTNFMILYISVTALATAAFLLHSPILWRWAVTCKAYFYYFLLL